MTNEQLLNEIREANMTYLMLAQNLIRQDKPEALFRLGMSEESADHISALSPAQIMRIASSNSPLVIGVTLSVAALTMVKRLLIQESWAADASAWCSRAAAPVAWPMWAY